MTQKFDVSFVSVILIIYNTLFGPKQQVTTHKLKLIEFHTKCCEDKVLLPQLEFFFFFLLQSRWTYMSPFDHVRFSFPT